MVCRIPVELAENSWQVLSLLVGRNASVADNGSQRSPSFCIFGRPYELGGLETGRSCLHISFVRVDFLSSSVFFRSVESVGSVASFL